MALLLNNVMIIMKICLLRIFKLDILLWRHRVWEAEEVRRCCVPARPLARLYRVRQWVGWPRQPGVTSVVLSWVWPPAPLTPPDPVTMS